MKVYTWFVSIMANMGIIVEGCPDSRMEEKKKGTFKGLDYHGGQWSKFQWEGKANVW